MEGPHRAAGLEGSGPGTAPQLHFQQSDSIYLELKMLQILRFKKKTTGPKTGGDEVEAAMGKFNVTVGSMR